MSARMGRRAPIVIGAFVIVVVLTAQAVSARGLTDVLLGATTTTSAAAAPTAKGDVDTAERRLVDDPNTLWVGTADENGFSNWGQSAAIAPKNLAITRAPAGGHGNAVRIYNAGGGTEGDRWGSDARFTFEKIGISPQNEAYLRYYVWFPSDYEWKTSGKMAALQGVIPGGSTWWPNNTVKCPAGHPYEGKACHDDRQFGTRTLWKNQMILTYLNVHAIGQREHDDLRLSSGDINSFTVRYIDEDGQYLKFKRGWNFVEQRVKLNTPGERDGVFEGWLNGVRGVHLTSVEYRTSEYPDLQISQWELVHFWGGPPTEYPERATNVYYDDIVISRSPIGERTD